MRVRLSGSAVSAIEVDVLDAGNGEYPAIRAAYRRGSLIVTSDTAAALWREVVDLSNDADERAHARGVDISAEERRFNAIASRPLSTASSKIAAQSVNW